MTRITSIAIAGLATFLAVALVSAQGAAPGQGIAAGHGELYPRADIEHGLRVYAENCDRCHGPDGQGVAGFNLASGKFRSATTDQQLRMVITNGFPTAGMPPTRLDPVDLGGLVAYLRNMNAIDAGSLKPGNPELGRAIVEGKGGCLTCHRIDGRGSYKGPNLSAVGARKSAGIIERSLVDPDGQLWPINRPVRIVTRNGTVINGRRLNEDTYTVQIVTEEGRLASFSKPELKEFRVLTKAGMPSYQKELTSEELSNVVSYLLTLKGTQ
jgi:putative heme-binding domain-containing protein